MNSVEQKRIIAIIAVLLIVLFVISVARKAVVPEENLTEEQNEANLNDEVKNIIQIPKTNHYFSPLLSVVPMQLIAYYTTVEKGLDVDKPRNLAKSVTVE